MREHVADTTTVDQIAAKVRLSRAHLFALFREQLNTTPQVFWSAVRVEEAMRRLVDEGESLTSVALDLGFSAPGNFSRFFKEHTGVSPSLSACRAGPIAGAGDRLASIERPPLASMRCTHPQSGKHADRGRTRGTDSRASHSVTGESP